MERFLLPDMLEYDESARARLTTCYLDGILSDPSLKIGDVAGNEFGVDLRARYGPFDLPHPIGKASGQLSLQSRQIEADAAAGLAFVVLKTVIAEDAGGAASMEAWRVRKPQMLVERITGLRVARNGWTVSWAGRGWEGSLASYLEFMREALTIGAHAQMPVIPSCKYNLPSSEAISFMESEYEYTTRLLAEAWRTVHSTIPLTIEQDFSPTLAGTGAAQSKRLILKWLNDSPHLIKKHDRSIQLGVKLMNAVFDDEFQLEMMRLLSQQDSAADFLICFNRLFDPERMFNDKKGIAYGGPDLSDRNLQTLREAISDPAITRGLPVSATGDIGTGQLMLEYALRGATSGQLHTYFQLPLDQFQLKGVSRTRAALHELFFHPGNGIIAGMLHIKRALSRQTEMIRFNELQAIGRKLVSNSSS